LSKGTSPAVKHLGKEEQEEEQEQEQEQEAAAASVKDQTLIP
jgi:hypothetical protein